MLSQTGVAFREREIFREPLSVSELEALLNGRSPQDLLSRKSTRFKELGLEGKELGDEELLELLAREPGLLRRPLVTAGGELVVGLDKDKLAKLAP